MLLVSLIYFFQETLLFLPKKLPSDYNFNLSNVTEVKIPVLGAELSALHYQLPNPNGIVFFLHGNAENLAIWLTDTSFYEKVNYDLFMIDFRGYGKSTGQIESEEQLFSDVAIAWDKIADKYQGKRIVIYGRSLGTALAARLSLSLRPDLTILVSPYYSMSEMADLYYPWVPKFALRYPLDTASYVRGITNPILILHGDMDTLIPSSQSEKLVALNSNARLSIISGAHHDDMHHFKSYQEELEHYLTRILPLTI